MSNTQKDSASKTGAKVQPKPRPLSPHLSIYKPQITSMMSISHRASGVFNFVGLIILVAYLYSVSSNNTECFETMNGFISSIIGQLFIAGAIFSVYYHLCNGLRHLAWDFGYGFELDNVTKSGLVVFVISIALSVITILALI